MSFADKLMELRRTRGWSQEELGNRLEVTRQTVSKWELGQTTPEMNKLVELSALFDIGLDELLDTPFQQEKESSEEQAGYLSPWRHFEYKSKRTLFGLPFVHVNIGRGLYRAKGVIAVGMAATGLLSVGLLSAGVGWHYGPRDQWETEFLVGFLPRYERERVSATFTLKQRFRPWVIPVSSRWEIDPLTTGLFFNTISGENFWSREPSRYPKRYYGFSTKIRTHVFLGQRLRYNIPTRNRLYNKSVTLYYELSTCDLYLVSAIPNSNVRLSDILSLCFGVRMEMF